MKFAKLLLGLAAAGVVTTVNAAVTIEYGDEIEMLSVNEDRPQEKGSGMFSSTKTITLPDGENQIVFRYEPYFDQGNDRVSVPSQVIIAKINQTDAELKFDMPNFRDARTARKKIDPLQWSLVDESGQKIAVEEDTLVRHGYQLSRDFPREAQDYNRAQQGPAALTLQAVAVPAVVAAKTQTEAPKTQAAPQVASDDTAEEMLHFWYQKADAETKARFKAFVNGQ
ncbi:DUF2057 family protein [Vibrio sp. SCSIO 43136]|uniref:DUF2057 family protein n=1 Tax=Vibrio sp. SCSIO 43136 TaxID=2819101 RepID=UPI00207540DD|nr:DUF2057 family protein [Vibrio sp. SCSIO 43136]USD66929.1 DUF2057 family protein [Vibrio sp. SCSIO 43136]